MASLATFSRVGNLNKRIEKVSATAAKHASQVDFDARFPVEAIAEMKEQRLLGILAPRELGGEEARIGEVADVCYGVGRSCSSTAMIFAMHQIMAAILVRHGHGWHRELLRRIAEEQLLLASSTTEGQGGGDLRASDCAIVEHLGQIELRKHATVMSYGAHADGLLSTARRDPQAAPSDQVVAAFLKKDYQLDPIQSWDTLGMRGTCSTGFSLTARGGSEQVLPEAYVKIQAQTMMPVAHLTWGAVWTGIAAAAVERARRLMRTAVRRSGKLPPGATDLTQAQNSLQILRVMLTNALAQFDTADETGSLETLEFQTAMNLLKVNLSNGAIATVMSSLQACGLSGYRNDSEFSVARHLRDVVSSSLMINNARILASVGDASLLLGAANTLRN